jgi:hypothetical protein
VAGVKVIIKKKEWFYMNKKQYSKFCEEVKKILISFEAEEVTENYFIIKKSKLGKLTFSLHEYYTKDTIYSLYSQFEDKEKYSEIFNTYNTSSKHNFHCFDNENILIQLESYLRKIIESEAGKC